VIREGTNKSQLQLSPSSHKDSVEEGLMHFAAWEGWFSYFVKLFYIIPLPCHTALLKNKTNTIITQTILFTGFLPLQRTKVTAILI